MPKIPRKKPVQHEQKLQTHVVNYIRAEWPQVRICAHVPNGGSRNEREGKRLKEAGVLAGFPDLILYWKHGHGIIELKYGTNKASDTQQEILDRIHDCGFLTAVCRSLTEVHETLIEWGLTPRRDALQQYKSWYGAA